MAGVRVPDNPGAWLMATAKHRAIDLLRRRTLLELVDALVSDPSLAGDHLLPGVRGDLLAKLGRFDEARVEFARAAFLRRNGRERKLLLERASGCAPTV